MQFYGGILLLMVAFHSSSAKESTGLLEKSLTSLERLLIFFHSRVDQMSLDAALGVAIADGQLLSAIRDVGSKYSSTSKGLIKKLYGLKYRCSTILSRTRKILRQNNRDGFVALGRLLDPWYWDTDPRVLECDKSSVGSFPTFSAFEEQVDVPNGPSSDACIAELLARRCEGVEPACWREEFAPEASAATGYALSHRLIYAHVATKEPYCVGKTKSEMDVIICSICRKILRDVKEIEGQGFPTQYRDLFMEQVALCGIENFVEFSNPLWLRNMLSWQQPSGCYGSSKELRREVSLLRSILKRSESVMDYGCLSHASGVALASLAVNVRLMVQFP